MIWISTGALAMAAACAGCSSEAPITVPAQLASVESSAEATFDQVLASDLAGARTSADELAAAWTAYKPRGLRDNVPVDAVSAIDQAIAALPQALAGMPRVSDAGRAVNAVSAPMSRLYAVYSPTVPVAVLDLDYLGRELLIDSLVTDPALATGHVDKIEATWTSLKPELIAAGGAAEASNFEAAISSARSAISAGNAPDLEAAAKNELDIVDAIEHVFSTAGDTGD